MSETMIGVESDSQYRAPYKDYSAPHTLQELYGRRQPKTARRYSKPRTLKRKNRSE